MLEIITNVPNVSHLDHNLKPAHLAWLLAHYAERNAFFIETIEIPEHLGKVDCGLYGPLMGDPPVPEESVFYGVRGERKWATRVVNMPMRATRLLTVIAGPAGVKDGLSEDKPCVLYTTYGGPPAPREPGDPSIGADVVEKGFMSAWGQLVMSRKFWAEHALAMM